MAYLKYCHFPQFFPYIQSVIWKTSYFKKYRGSSWIIYLYSSYVCRCDHKKSCEIQASSAIFGDPCPNTPKYLEVTYFCYRGKVRCQGSMFPWQPRMAHCHLPHNLPNFNQKSCVHHEIGFVELLSFQMWSQQLCIFILRCVFLYFSLILPIITINVLHASYVCFYPNIFRKYKTIRFIHHKNGYSKTFHLYSLVRMPFSIQEIQTIRDLVLEFCCVQRNVATIRTE